MFIVSCPASNAPLPFTAFPYLAYDGEVCTCEEPDCSSPSVYVKRGGAPCAPPSAGDTVSFTAVAKIPAGSYLTFVNGLAIASVAGKIWGKYPLEVGFGFIHTNRFPGKSISAAIPDTIVGGQTYVFVTSSDITGDFSAFDDTAVLFGPALLEVNPPPPVIHYKIQ